MNSCTNTDNSLLYFTQNHLSAGMIGNHSNITDYKTIDKIRSEMISLLQKQDQLYSIDNLNNSIQKAMENLGIES